MYTPGGVWNEKYVCLGEQVCRGMVGGGEGGGLVCIWEDCTAHIIQCEYLHSNKALMHRSHMHVTCCPVQHALSTHPFHCELQSLEVYNADGAIASLPNAPLHSLPGGEGQEGPLLKGSNTLCVRKYV